MCGVYMINVATISNVDRRTAAQPNGPVNELFNADPFAFHGPRFLLSTSACHSIVQDADDVDDNDADI